MITDIIFFSNISNNTIVVAKIVVAKNVVTNDQIYWNDKYKLSKKKKKGSKKAFSRKNILFSEFKNRYLVNSNVDNFKVKFDTGCLVRVLQWSFILFLFKRGKAAMDYYFATCYALGRCVKW